MRKHFGKESSNKKKTTTVDEAMDGLTLNTIDSDEEMNDYLENVVETKKKVPSSAKQAKHQNRKKKKAKRKNKN